MKGIGILVNRLSPYVTGAVIPESQCGFRRNISMTDIADKNYYVLLLLLDISKAVIGPNSFQQWPN